MVRRTAAARMVLAISFPGSSCLMVTQRSATLERSARNAAVEKYSCQTVFTLFHRGYWHMS